MPVVKKPADRGPLGAWARSARLQAGYKSAEAAVAALAAQGWQMRPDYLRGIEAGSARPGPETVAALERLYGQMAPARRPEPELTDLAADLRPVVDQLAAMLRATTEAIVDIRLELRDARRSAEEERAEMTRLLARLSEQLEAALAPAKRSGGSGARASVRPA